MDKSWMPLGKTATTNGRLSSEYSDGVFAFVKFAMKVADSTGSIRCPCKKCTNAYWYRGDMVAGHLLAYGIMQTYTVWNYHGETMSSTDRVEVQKDKLSSIDALVEDRKGGNIDPDALVEDQKGGNIDPDEA